MVVVEKAQCLAFNHCPFGFAFRELSKRLELYKEFVVCKILAETRIRFHSLKKEVRNFSIFTKKHAMDIVELLAFRFCYQNGSGREDAC